LLLKHPYDVAYCNIWIKLAQLLLIFLFLIRTIIQQVVDEVHNELRLFFNGALILTYCQGINLIGFTLDQDADHIDNSTDLGANFMGYVFIAELLVLKVTLFLNVLILHYVILDHLRFVTQKESRNRILEIDHWPNLNIDVNRGLIKDLMIPCEWVLL